MGGERPSHSAWSERWLLNTRLITGRGEKQKNYNQRRQATTARSLEWILMDFSISVKRYDLEPNQWLPLSLSATVQHQWVSNEVSWTPQEGSGFDLLNTLKSFCVLIYYRIHLFWFRLRLHWLSVHMTLPVQRIFRHDCFRLLCFQSLFFGLRTSKIHVIHKRKN